MELKEWTKKYAEDSKCEDLLEHHVLQLDGAIELERLKKKHPKLEKVLESSKLALYRFEERDHSITQLHLSLPNNNSILIEEFLAEGGEAGEYSNVEINSHANDSYSKNKQLDSLKEVMASVPMYDVTIGEFISFLDDLRNVAPFIDNFDDDYDDSYKLEKTSENEQIENKIVTNNLEKFDDVNKTKKGELHLIVENLVKENGLEFAVDALREEIVKLQTETNFKRHSKDERFKYFLEKCTFTKTVIGNSFIFGSTEIFQHNKLYDGNVHIMYDSYYKHPDQLSDKLIISSNTNNSFFLDGSEVFSFLRENGNSAVLDIMRECGLFDISVGEFFTFLFDLFDCYDHEFETEYEDDAENIQNLLNESLKKVTAKSARSTFDTEDEPPKKAQKLN